MTRFVLIPGLLCTGDLFAAQVEPLSRHGSVVVADTTRDDMIDAMAERLLDAARGEPLALVGLSMGGYVALAAARRAPDRVARLALLDTSARPDTPEASETRRRLIALAEAGRFAEVDDVLWHRLVAPDRLGDEDLRRRVVAMADEIGPETFVRQQRAIMARADQRPFLPQIEIPTLVLVGESDVITPPEVAEEMAEAIEWATLTRVPACGHLATLERPERVNAALEAWLAAT
ncbi:alpha/beta fold hydrolase [Salinarimonas ramus]|uniref:Alpha/beta hydrolase n=1 Tax=Salinarimonas ramus TaxID=690164 RepID=A0A917V8H5_9HYPH|nr:alpha/beta fold hydrolase [Salinarimonas ramus]GGK50240.1 alpha/beta hydrolase [Salinarimonas ramus]